MQKLRMWSSFTKRRGVRAEARKGAHALTNILTQPALPTKKKGREPKLAALRDSARSSRAFFPLRCSVEEQRLTRMVVLPEERAPRLAVLAMKSARTSAACHMKASSAACHCSAYS